MDFDPRTGKPDPEAVHIAHPDTAEWMHRLWQEWEKDAAFMKRVGEVRAKKRKNPVLSAAASRTDGGFKFARTHIHPLQDKGVVGRLDPVRLFRPFSFKPRETSLAVAGPAGEKRLSSKWSPTPNRTVRTNARQP